MDLDLKQFKNISPRVAHMQIDAGTLGGSTISGTKIVEILHYLRSGGAGIRIESIAFEGLDIEGPIKLSHESPDTVVPHIRFVNCRNVLLWAINSEFASIQIMGGTVDRVICSSARFTTLFLMGGCQIEPKTSIAGMPMGAVNMLGVSTPQLGLMAMQFSGETTDARFVILAGLRVEGSMAVQAVRGVSLINMDSTHIEGMLLFEQVQIERSEGSHAAIQMPGAVIGKNLTMNGVSASLITLENATVGGSCSFADVQLSSCPENTALWIAGLSVEKGITFTGCAFEGYIRADNVRVGAHVTLSKCSVGNGSPECFHAEGPRISGALLMHGCEMKGAVFVIHAKIGVNIELKQCSLAAPNVTALTLDGCACDGDLLIYDSTIKGQVSISGMKAGGSINFNKSTISDYPARTHYSYAINANRVEAGAALRMHECVCVDDITLADSKAGQLHIVNLEMVASPDQKRLFQCNLYLSRIEVETALELSDIRMPAGGQIDLSDTVCKRVNLTAYRDTPAKAENGVLLELNGLKYEAIGYMQHAEVSDMIAKISNNEIKKRHLVTQFAMGPRNTTGSWFKTAMALKIPRQPRSHMQLARVLYSQGWDSDANRVLWSMRRTMAGEASSLSRRGLLSIPVNLLRLLALKIFDLFFGYGYSRPRATATVMLWALLGWYGVETALERNMLVLDPAYVVSIIQPPAGAVGPSRLLQTLPGGDITCRGVIEPLFFAIDSLIPVFDFGQVSKCAVAFDREALATSFWRREATFWFAAQYLYTMLGWLILSLAALTFTGTLKDRVG